MTTALALRPPPPRHRPTSRTASAKKTWLSEKALELRRRVEKAPRSPGQVPARDGASPTTDAAEAAVIQQQEVHGSERLVDADLLQPHELFKRSGHQFNLGEKYERLGRDTQRACEPARTKTN